MGLRPSPSAPAPSSLELTPSAPSRVIGDEETIVGDGMERAPLEHALGRGDQVGRYLLIDALGRGAMGQVFRAYDPDLDRQVALKVLLGHATTDRDDHRDRLLREAKAMARIDHPNVVRVHDAGMHAGSVFIAMEIVDGPSLERWLLPPRPPAEILDVLTDAARGLAAAHAAGVVHRDFKPANVLVTPSGRAKVGDFGLAELDEATHSGHAMGTPAYMSPEHVAGVGIDARSDQFSFAITMYEALHGTRPFSATTWPELASQIVTGAVPPTLATRRGGIDGVLRRALSVEPPQRFASMDELIDALERARRPVWRRWLAVGAVALVVGVAALGRDDTDACEAGDQRIEAVWGATTKAALQIGGNDYTEVFSRRAREQFEEALDDYAARWAALHDESCAAVGPAAQRGTPAQQRTAQCLDNRLDSLQGLAELAAASPLDAGRVGDLVGTLPSLDDCTSGRWVPYPSDPEQAARAAELHRRLARIRRDRLADRLEHLPEDTRITLEHARELGEPYLLAHALTERAHGLTDREAITASFDEALAVALTAGFDLLAAEIVNHVLLSSYDDRKGWRELGHLVAMARGLVVRGGGNETLLGNLAINESNLLRRTGQLDRAMVRAQHAEEHFTRIRNRDGMARARITKVVTMMAQGQLADVVPRLQAAVEELEETDGASPLAFQAQYILTNGLLFTGRSREALEAAAELHRRARELYSPRSFTLRQAMFTHTAFTLNAGAAETALELLAELRRLPSPSNAESAELELLDLGLSQLRGHHEEVLAKVPDLRARFDAMAGRDERLMLELWYANSLFVLGKREEVHAVLASPLVAQSLRDPQVNESVRISLVWLAVLSDVPPPPGIPWRSVLPTDGLSAAFLNRHMIATVDAVETEADPVPTVRRIRDELIAAYNDREILVQILDAWLAGRSP